MALKEDWKEIIPMELILSYEESAKENVHSQQDGAMGLKLVGNWPQFYFLHN